MPERAPTDARARDPLQRAIDTAVDGLSRAGRPLKEAAARGALEIAALPALSRLTGWLSDRRVPRPLLTPLLRTYVRAYQVDLHDVAEPLASFPTFNAFFTRPLRAGARPIAADHDVIVSPADARVAELGHVPASGLIEQIKGRRYRLADLLGDEGEASPYRRGVHSTLYLSPRDYHRVHAPCDAAIVAWRFIPGRLFPVNRLAVGRVDGLFTVNARIALHLVSERFGDLALVMVGASNVGRMTLSFEGAGSAPRGATGPTTVRPAAPVRVRRGDELGVFNLGSTVVLLASDPALRATAALPGEHIEVGQPLWRRGE